MAKNDNGNSSGSGSGSGSEQPGGVYTWEGADPQKFNKDKFSDQFATNILAGLNQGPAVFDQSLHAGLGDETKGLIDTGLAGVMGDVAGGNWLDGGNPYFEQNLNRSLDNAATRVNSMFSNSGRLGSTEHVQDLSEGLANAENTARMQNFETEYGRMGDALRTNLGLAGLLDADQQAQLLGENDLFRRQNDAALTHTGNWMNLLNSGTQDATVVEPENPFLNILGGGLGLASLFI